MQFNLSITGGSANELLTALSTLAGMPQTAAPQPAAKPEPKQQAATPALPTAAATTQTAETEATVTDGVTLEDVRKAVQAKASGHAQAIREILAEQGAKNVSELKGKTQVFALVLEKINAL